MLAHGGQLRAECSGNLECLGGEDGVEQGDCPRVGNQSSASSSDSRSTSPRATVSEHGPHSTSSECLMTGLGTIFLTGSGNQ